MAVNSYDPVDGHPIFVDSDAPDVKVDPTEAAKYAGKVGTRLIGTTADRTAYTFAREGLEWYDTDLDSVFLHSGSGWRLWERGWTSYTPTTAGITGTVAASYKVDAGLVTVRFRVTAISAVSGDVTLTLPVTAFDAVTDYLLSAVGFIPNSGSEAIGAVRRLSATSAAIRTLIVASGQTYAAALSSGAPIVWASARLEAYFQYQAA